MPNGDSLEIRHTPGTVPGGARPGWGLPFQQLPSATRRDLTPESILNEEIQTGKQQIQDKYAIQWKAANQSRRFVGGAKTQRKLQEIDARAKQEMLQFDQQAQQQMNQLRDINQLAELGAIDTFRRDKLKMAITQGRAVAEAVYQEPEKEKSPMQQFAALDTYSHRISDELDRFRVKKPSMLRKLKSISPLATAISTLRGPGKLKIQIWDPDKGKHVDTNKPEDIARYVALLQEEKAIIQRKDELYGQLDISRRTAQPGAGSGFDAGVTESITPQRTPTVVKPKFSDPLKLF